MTMECYMDALNEKTVLQEEQIVSDYVKLKMLQHMAEGLEDEAAGLGCRAEGLQEEEFLLARGIDEHYTEINRLLLKLQGLRSQRYDLLEKIEHLRSEASVLRERVWTGEDDLALDSLAKAGAVSDEDFHPDDAGWDDIRRESCYESGVGQLGPGPPKGAGLPAAPVFFRMLTAANVWARTGGQGDPA